MNNEEWVTRLSKQELGKIHIHRGEEMIHIYPEELEKYLNEGWIEGQHPKVTRLKVDKCVESKTREMLEHYRVETMEELKELLENEYFKNNMTYQDIADKYGRSYNVLRTDMYNCGIRKKTRLESSSSRKDKKN